MRHTATTSVRQVVVLSAVGVFLFATAVSPTGCSRRSAAHESQPYPSEIEALAVNRRMRDPLVAAQSRGRSIYEHYCRICHGAQGRGDGFNATNLKTPPRNFADPAFWKQTSAERVALAIREGGKAVGKSVLMPAWGRTLSEGQISDVVAFLRTLEAAPTSQSDAAE